MTNRRVGLTEKNAEQTFRRLIDWLGEREIRRKLGTVQRELLQSEPGLYLEQWLRPKNLWWPKPQVGRRTPEFIRLKGEFSYKVECKSKTVDAGRIIARPSFYKVVDAVVKKVRKRGLYGDVHILTPGRMSTTAEWQELVADSIGGQLDGTSQIYLGDGTKITTSFSSSSGKSTVPRHEVNSKLSSLKNPFTHAAVHVLGHSETAYESPLVVSAESCKKNSFLANVMLDIRDAKRQLSGTRTGIIACFVPEVDQFDHLESNSALQRLCIRYFERHAPDSIYSVTFVSDRQTEVTRDYVDTFYPSITFYNAHYNKKWGPAEKYMATSF